MTEKWCGICQRRHTYQAYESPTRETPRDFWLAALTWTVILAAYIVGAYALWTRGGAA